MSTRDESDDVRRAIQELRDRDTRFAGAPSLASVMQRRRTPRTARLVSPVRIALAAAALVVAVLGYGISVRRPHPAPPHRTPLVLPREVAALSTWRPMTDVLLNTPGRELLRDTSPLGRSIIRLAED